MHGVEDDGEGDHVEYPVTHQVPAGSLPGHSLAIELPRLAQAPRTWVRQCVDVEQVLPTIFSALLGNYLYLLDLGR